MIRQLLSFVVVLLVVQPLSAVPAYPRKVVYVLDDGTETVLTLKGDEHCKWALTEDGYTVLPGEDGWYYAMADSTQRAVRSVHKLCAVGQRTEPLRRFLSVQPRGMVPAIAATRTRKAPARATSSQRSPVVGRRRALVVLMAFSDQAFTRSQADFDALFNQPRYSEDGAQGSVNDYFREASYGQLDMVSDVLGPYTAQYAMAYYGRNTQSGDDANPHALFREALSYAAAEVNLADYDTDGDGYVDNLHIIFAGYGEEAGGPSNAIWSHEAAFSAINVQQVKVDRYSCTPELRGNKGTGLSRIGPCCHEIGHALGAMDYYDTDYSAGGQFVGTGQWDIMADGSWNNEGITPAHFNPYTKAYDFGWVDVHTLHGSGTLQLQPSTTVRHAIYRIDTPADGEFYLMENRIRSGFDAYLPGEGLMLYHAHPSMDTKLRTNKINATAPQMFYPVCASASVRKPSSQPSSYGSINSAGCPFPVSASAASFTTATVPAAFCWDGTDPDFGLTDIVRGADGTVGLSYTVGEPVPAPDGETVWAEGFEDDIAAAEWFASGISSELDWSRQEVLASTGTFASWDDIIQAADGTHYICLKRNMALREQSGIAVAPRLTDTSGGGSTLHSPISLSRVMLHRRHR